MPTLFFARFTSGRVRRQVNTTERAKLAIRDSEDVPAPNFVLDTSPGKQQVVWKIEGVDQDQAESLLRSLANEFGGDPAATDSTRDLRDFTVQEVSPDAPRHIEDAHTPSRAAKPSRKSQSEHDWAYAKRALARGDDPETVIQRIADYRGNEKHSGYARRTVEKAQKELERENIPSEQRAASIADAGQPGRED